MTLRSIMSVIAELRYEVIAKFPDKHYEWVLVDILGLDSSVLEERLRQRDALMDRRNKVQSVYFNNITKTMEICVEILK